MQKILGIAVLGLLCSIPAQAQGRFGGSGIGSSSSAPLNFGGGTVNGGSVLGDTVSHIPSYSRAQFDTASYGGDSSFAPSSFLPFPQAVAAGNAANAEPKSVAQAAAENPATRRAKSRVSFVQDGVGHVVPVPRS